MIRTAKQITGLTLALTLGACALLQPQQPDDVAPPAQTGAQLDVSPAGPVATSAPPPSRSAKTPEALDTTTPAQRTEAAAPVRPSARAKNLGTTIASLGSPTEPGFWLKTPLVKTHTQGRVTNTANGKSSAVTLIPIGGPVTGGSRMSLPAMRLIEASLNELTEVEVTIDG